MMIVVCTIIYVLEIIPDSKIYLLYGDISEILLQHLKDSLELGIPGLSLVHCTDIHVCECTKDIFICW